MINRVKQFIISHSLIPTLPSSLFAAVSGGIDSCVLLHILNKLQPELGYDLAGIHFNHAVRGPESKKDEEFVEALAHKYGIPIQIGRIAGVNKKWTETRLREERLKFFSRIATQKRNAIIATGHNLNDNIETFLMRVAKGTRLKGMLAIRPKRGVFIRPLLGEKREQIENYAKKYKLDYRFDQTNLDNSILRNKIRNEILPSITREINPKFIENVANLIQEISIHWHLFEEKLHEAVVNTTRKSKHGISLHRRRYQQYNKVVRRGLIEYCISSLYPLNYHVSDKNFSVWDNFVKQAQAGKKQTFLEEGMALAERNYIMFGELPQDKTDKYRLAPDIPLLIDNKYKIMMKKIPAAKVKFIADKNIEYIDADKSGDDLTVRFWQKGDAFKPLGMKHTRKLSDFFIDLKLTATRKREIPIILSKKNKIVWIAGYRIDEAFKISLNTKNVYKLVLKELKN